MDINGDGQNDILSGSYSRMEQAMAGLFHVLYGNEDGTFRPAEVLNGADGEPLIIPADKQTITQNICTRPFAVDWDADGHLDLVVGNFAGTFYWFKGQGQGQFEPKPEAIQSGGSPLHVEGHHSDPFVIDWDGDGDLDLLSGSSNGGVQWAENSAGQGKLPELQAFQTLIEVGQTIAHGQRLDEDDLTGPTSSTRIWVDDVNGDDKLDLLVGDSVTLISPANGLTDEEFTEKYEAWQKAVAEASSARSAALVNQAKKAAEAAKADAGDGKAGEGDEADEAYEANAGDEAEEGDEAGEAEGDEADEGAADEADEAGEAEADEADDAEAAKADAADELTKATEELHKLYGQRSEFMHEDRTGFVWLYLQK